MSTADWIAAAALLVAGGSLWKSSVSTSAAKRSAKAAEVSASHARRQADAAEAVVALERQRDEDARAPVFDVPARFTGAAGSGNPNITGVISNIGSSAAIVERCTLRYPAGAATGIFQSQPPVRIEPNETIVIEFRLTEYGYGHRWADETFECDVDFRAAGANRLRRTVLLLKRDGSDHMAQPVWRLHDTRVATPGD